MGKKKAAAGEKEEPAPEEKAIEAAKEDEGPADPPIVVELKKVDDEYLEIEREYERAVNALQKKYTEQQAPLLEQRQKLLTASEGVDEEAKTMGTPSLTGFWLQAMKHLPALEDQIEMWDEPVLQYLSDVQKSPLDPEAPDKGFKLSFKFVENPFFENDELWKEYHTEETSPYTGQIDTQEIKVSEINWKPGKDVTVEVIKKKAKGGGAKKAKQKKEKEEPRDSFFRNFFRNLRPDMPLPDDVNLEDARQLCGDDSDEDDEEMITLLMENDYEIGCSIRDQLVPFAVRWFTGEAQPEGYGDDDDFDDEEDEEEDDDDEDDEEDSEDEPPPKKKAGGKERQGGGKKAGGGEGEKECKQQ